MDIREDYSVWATNQATSNGRSASVLVAQFYFLQEALDYAENVSKRGIHASDKGFEIVVQGPYHYRTIRKNGERIELSN